MKLCELISHTYDSKKLTYIAKRSFIYTGKNLSINSEIDNHLYFSTKNLPDNNLDAENRIPVTLES